MEDALSAHTEEIQKLSHEFKLEAVMTCEVKSTTSMPSLRFPGEFVQWVASMGAVLDVDIMLLDLTEGDKGQP